MVDTEAKNRELFVIADMLADKKGLIEMDIYHYMTVHKNEPELVKQAEEDQEKLRLISLEPIWKDLQDPTPIKKEIDNIAQKYIR